MNDLTIIITYYDSEDYISDCINSVKNQRVQDFDIIIVNDGSNDESTKILMRELESYNKKINYINLDGNYGHAKARNIAMENVKTPYFMFLDADDQLATYAIGFYLEKLNGLDSLIAPIHKFTLQKPQYINQNEVIVKQLNYNTNPNSFLRKNTACNMIFKTSIVRKFSIKFNENIQIYIDNSFLLDYASHVKEFVRIFNFPFYHRGEIYDPFKTQTLTAQEFDILFKDY